jgi:hypothetical protein
MAVNRDPSDMLVTYSPPNGNMLDEVVEVKLPKVRRQGLLAPMDLDTRLIQSLLNGSETLWQLSWELLP